MKGYLVIEDHQEYDDCGNPQGIDSLIMALFGEEQKAIDYADKLRNDRDMSTLKTRLQIGLMDCAYHTLNDRNGSYVDDVDIPIEDTDVMVFVMEIDGSEHRHIMYESHVNRGFMNEFIKEHAPEVSIRDKVMALGRTRYVGDWAIELGSTLYENLCKSITGSDKEAK